MRLNQRARADGIDVELVVWDGMWLSWHLFAAYVPQGGRAVEGIAAFSGRHLR